MCLERMDVIMDVKGVGVCNYVSERYGCNYVSERYGCMQLCIRKVWV